MKKTIAFFLLIAISLTNVACGGSSSTSTETTTSPETTESVTETGRADISDNLPELDFEGKKITIVSNGDWNGTEEQTGDVVNDAIYQSNKKVEERLNIELEFLSTGVGQSQFSNDMRTVITAGDDSYDIMMSGQCYLIKLVPEKLFIDLSDAKYLDFDQPWWAQNYMATLDLNGNRYCLVGDLSTGMIGSMSAVFVNKRLWSDNFGDFDAFYEEILDGKWTFERMGYYVETAFRDLNADGICDDNDIIGMVTTASSPTEHFAFPAGLKLSERGKDGKVSLVTDQTRNVRIFEAMYELYFNNPGTNVAADANKLNNEFEVMFASGNVLFYPDRLGKMEKFRDMEDDYAIIPRPKLDEAQESYLSLVHDSFGMYNVPITLAEDKLDMVCATLEAMCAEYYREVTPAYYDVALKVKYSRDDYAGQMLDIIRDNAYTDFIYAYNYALGNGGKLGTIGRTLMTAKSSDYMSTYTSMESQVKAAIDALYEIAQ